MTTCPSKNQFPYICITLRTGELQTTNFFLLKYEWENLMENHTICCSSFRPEVAESLNHLNIFAWHLKKKRKKIDLFKIVSFLFFFFLHDFFCFLVDILWLFFLNHFFMYNLLSLNSFTFLLRPLPGIYLRKWVQVEKKIEREVLQIKVWSKGLIYKKCHNWFEQHELFSPLTLNLYWDLRNLDFL